MIKEHFHSRRPTYSIEVFPPKPETDISVIYDTLDEVRSLQPDFISVTYGAGGSTSQNTFAIANYIQNQCHIEALCHLTCIAMKDELYLKNFLTSLYRGGVKNILALRGDKPVDMSEEKFNSRFYQHASDLVTDIKKNYDFCIGGACYPEVHPEAADRKEDIKNLKIKVDRGVDFVTTQLFYDNEVFYRFLEDVRKEGIEVPVLAGLMPVTSYKQIDRIVSLSGTKLEKGFASDLEKYKDSDEDIKKLSIEYTRKQMEELLKHGVNGIHLYSMNKAEIAKAIFD
ncbi:MAG: methylenetetrahydrofolate reductase [NAD(P)H] [Eubacterium sp.]|nr:methylenetetrahydrofolate reductase [NAD(P)H] [Eubacterium sp.]